MLWVRFPTNLAYKFNYVTTPNRQVLGIRMSGPTGPDPEFLRDNLVNCLRERLERIQNPFPLKVRVKKSADS